MSVAIGGNVVDSTDLKTGKHFESSNTITIKQSHDRNLVPRVHNNYYEPLLVPMHRGGDIGGQRGLKPLHFYIRGA